MTYSEVKNLVERVTGIEDLASEKRTRFIADCRFIYYQLCQRYVPIPMAGSATTHLRLMGDMVARDRTSVIHGLNEFQFLSRDKTWHGGWVYKLCVNVARNEKREKLKGIWKPPIMREDTCPEKRFAIQK